MDPGPGYMSPVCPSPHRTRYGGSPFAPLTSSTSPSLVGWSVWLAARMMRSPWCAFIVGLLVLVWAPWLGKSGSWLMPGAKPDRVQQSTTADHRIRAKRPVFALGRPTRDAHQASPVFRLLFRCISSLGNNLSKLSIYRIDTLSLDDGEVDVFDDDEVQELARGCA